MGNLPQRKQLRLKDYDYSLSGYYFVTVCTNDRQNLLCDIGFQIENSILNIPSVFTSVYIDQYVIMPNHIHVIIVITEMGGHGNPPLHNIIGRFKSFTTYEYNKINNPSKWQEDKYFT